MEDVYSSLLAKELDKNLDYATALGIVKRNTHGNIWLVGGTVYRTMCRLLYCVKSNGHDFDFLVDWRNPAPDLPDGWGLERNHFGTRWKGPSMSIDAVPLCEVHSITRRGLDPSIDAYLSGVPLDVQSVAFDVDAGRIVGEVGMRAILRATVAINNAEEAEYMAKLKGETVDELVAASAQKLGFFPSAQYY